MVTNKVVIVTGGSRGIGYAAVKKFLEHGAKAALLGSRQETVEAALQNLRAENPAYEVIGLWPALTNPSELAEAFKTVQETFGRINILINNAGISQSTSLYDYTSEEFQNIIELNVNAAFFCAREAAKYMKEQGGGVILNTSSMVSIYGQAAGCGYPTSKFAVNGMTKSLARELE